MNAKDLRKKIKPRFLPQFEAIEQYFTPYETYDYGGAIATKRVGFLVSADLDIGIVRQLIEMFQPLEVQCSHKVDNHAYRAIRPMTAFISSFYQNDVFFVVFVTPT